jgi:hypothetical protein
VEQLEAPTKHELNNVKSWFDQNEQSLPEDVRNSLRRVLAVYLGLAQSAKRAKATLQTLRMAMGFVPKSERGAQANVTTGAVGPAPTIDLRDPAFDEIRRKRDEFQAQVNEYNRRLREARNKAEPNTSTQLEFDLARPCELMFSYPTATREVFPKEQVVNRMQEFEKTKGLHVAHDYPKRVDLKIVVTEIQYKVETVTDPETGKSVRASMADEGPENFQMTWGAIANLIKLHVGFAIPINRLVLIIGQPEFSSSKICRVLHYVAMNLMFVYLYLAEEIADSAILSGDDTTTKVIDVTEEKPDSLAHEIDERLGFVSKRADGTGDKKAINVSLLVGKPEADPRSTIRFFRSHVGSVGNLLNRLLEWRSPKAGPVIFQGDLSPANLPSPELQERFRLAVAGCGAHARRPFWRFRNDDPSLCFYMLRGFLMLTQIEHRIDAIGRTRANVLKLRGRYALWIWRAMKNRCIAAVTGDAPSAGTYPNGITPNIWPPTTDLNAAAMYVINHFEELTLYLEHPALQYTNNSSERALRIEKCMLSGSKFRKTKNGRAVLDILRTINATCTAARLDITDYLRYVFKHLDELHDHPEKFTPYAVARHLENLKASPRV